MEGRIELREIALMGMVTILAHRCGAMCRILVVVDEGGVYG
jgi:hypothetical protein